MKRIILLIGLLVCGLFISFNLIAQPYSYTYSAESFEENIWSNTPDSENLLNSATGTWLVKKGNIQTTEVTAQEGLYSLLIANKTNAITTPRLDNGAGVLTYWAIKTGSRTITVETTIDEETWILVETFKVESNWQQRTVVINDPAVRYIRFSSNSNKGVYLDNILITAAGASGVTTTTNMPFQISQTSAMLSGTISSDGTATITGRGICYNDSGFPDINSNKKEAEGTTGLFTVTIDELEMGRTYYAKAYALTSSGISYGFVVPFTTREPDAPIAYWTQAFDDETQFPGSQPTTPQTINVAGQGDWIYLNAYKSTNPFYITDGSAFDLRLIKNGSYVITPILDAGVSKLVFTEGRGERELTVYSSTNEGGTWNEVQSFETVKGVQISIPVYNAGVNRIKIANNSGSDADIDNITLTVYPTGNVPVLSTTSVSNIGKNTATSGGYISEQGSKPVLKRGVCWSTVTTPIIADNFTVEGEGTGSFSSSLSNLPAGTLIHLRAYATSRAGTAYGNEVIFTTLAPTIPVISTTIATQVKGELATSGGNITDNGGAAITQHGVCWNTSGQPTVNDQKTTDSTGTGSFESIMAPLKTNTSYFYRAYASNIAGTGYGAEFSFKTGNTNLPEVSTLAVTSIYFYKATGNGTVNNDGDAITTRGLCWNTTGNPTILDDTTICGTGAGTFSGILNGLTENRYYYVRAFATNSMGTVYGEEVSFSTPLSTKLQKPIGYGEGTSGGGSPTPDNTITVTNPSELSAAINGNKSVILVSGTIETSQIRTTIKNKSIIGLPGARLINLNKTQSGSGIFYFTEGSENVIVQNLIFEGPGAYDTDGNDLLTNKGCTKLWVDHCEFQDGLDGNFDNSLSSDSITVSWCRFTYLKPPITGGSGGSDDHRFSNLVGGSDSDYPADGHYSITWQNCWWDKGVVARMIRGRNTEIHMLNCYWNSPDTKDAIGLTAGVNGSTMYVEGGVFEIPGDPADIGSGPISINFIECIGGGTNIGTVTKPAYEYLPMEVSEVVSAVTSTDCGAGATLMVTQSGEVYSGCQATPILTCTGNLNQVVYTGNPISNLLFSWGGTATDATVTGLPNGLINSKDIASKTITISGIPTESGTFTVTSTGGAGIPATKTATITITTEKPATLDFTNNINQTVISGSPIENIVFTWGGGANDVLVTGLPTGLNTTKNESAKTITISGIPSTTSTYTVSTIGGSGNAVLIQGTISVMFTEAPFKIAYVSNPGSSSYMNDLKILPALKADPNFEVTEINSAVSGNNYSAFDLVLFSEVAPSTDPGVAELKGINKPFIMMKVHAYKSDNGAWNWASSSTAYGQNETETQIVVTNKTHPVFKDVKWLNTNEIQILTEVNGLKGLTFMNPTQFKNVLGGTINTLAHIKGQASEVCIFEIPAGTTVAGTLISKNFIQIGINSSSYANVTNDGISIIKNACLYLLADSIPDAVDLKTQISGISSFKCFPTITANSLNVSFNSSHTGGANITICDINGKISHAEQIQFQQGETNVLFDLSTKHSGFYILLFQTGEKLYTQKFYKK